MAQYLVVHTWPDGSHSIMPEIFAGEVSADIHRDHCNAIKHDRPGHKYVTAIVSSMLHVALAAREPKPAWPHDPPLPRTDAEVSKMARV